MESSDSDVVVFVLGIVMRVRRMILGDEEL